MLTTDEVMSVEIVPNQVVEIKNPYIQPLTGTVPFYLRAKLEYKYYAGETEIFPANEIQTLAELLVLDDANNAFTFSADFLPDANKEWFYYCSNANYATAGKNQLVSLDENSAQVDIFGSTNLTVQNFTVEFGSPNDVTKIEVYLVVEALQAAATSADAYGLPADGDLKGGSAPVATTIDLENNSGTLTYIVEDATVTITELTGEIPEVSAENMAFAEGKTVTMDPAILNGITEIKVYNKELLDYFAMDYYPNSMEAYHEIYIYTSEELYLYLEDQGLGDFAIAYVAYE